jgi:hypothetical protein
MSRGKFLICCLSIFLVFAIIYTQNPIIGKLNRIINEKIHIRAIESNHNPNLTLGEIYKSSSIFLGKGFEATPIEFHGKLYAIVSERPISGITRGVAVDVVDLNTGKIIIKIDTPDFGFISAVVVDDKIYLFGTSDWSQSNEVRMMSSVDLKNWSAPVTILKPIAGEIIFNTSVTKSGKDFTMAYEARENPMTTFTPKFAKSSDLIHWQKVGNAFDPKNYAACPTIRFIKACLLYALFSEQKCQIYNCSC